MLSQREISASLCSAAIWSGRMAFHGVHRSQAFRNVEMTILEVHGIHGQSAPKANQSASISDFKPSLVQLDANPSGEPFP